MRCGVDGTKKNHQQNESDARRHRLLVFQCAFRQSIINARCYKRWFLCSQMNEWNRIECDVKRERDETSEKPHTAGFYLQ